MNEYTGFAIKLKSPSEVNPYYQKIKSLFGEMETGACVYNGNYTSVFIERNKDGYPYPIIKAHLIWDIYSLDTLYLILDKNKSALQQSIESNLKKLLNKRRFLVISPFRSVSKMSSSSIDELLGIKD